MDKIAIVTDTDSSFSEDYAKANGIIMVPIMVQFGGNSYRDTYDLSNNEVFTRIDKEGKLPTTSAPSPGQFSSAFKQAFDQGYKSILCFAVSKEVSATYASALTAKEEFPEMDITVIDSQSLTLQQGFMVKAASEAIMNGADKEFAIAAAVDIRDNSFMFAALSTLKYLAMSGRVGHLAAGFGKLLNIKPILTIRNGKLELLEKVRTQKKAWDQTIDLVAEQSYGKQIQKLSIIHVNVPDKAQEFCELMKTKIKCPEKIEIFEINPGLSIHSGAGMVGAVAAVEPSS